MFYSEAEDQLQKMVGEVININSCLEDEVDAIIQYSKRWDDDDKKATRDDAVVMAFKRMTNWYNNAHEYKLDINNPLDIAKFASTHRKACFTMILLGKAVQQREGDSETDNH